MFQIEGTLQDGTPLPVIEVRADKYDDMEWVTPMWGARPIIYATRSARNHVRVAIQYLSGRIRRRTVYAHTGWRQINDRWVYLHAGGAISGAGPVASVAVLLPDSLARFRLPDPPLWGDVGDIRASLGLLSGLAPDRTVYPLVAALWRSVLGDTDLTVALNGLTGSFKSELAALPQRHCGVGLDARHLPANWYSTANALEAIAHAAKDALLVIDDFCPPTGPEASRYHQKADQVLRGAGNGAGRQRMRADTSLRPAKPPRCLIVSTGEESPRGQSLQARMMQIDVAPGAVNSERLTECQRDAAAGRYALTRLMFQEMYSTTDAQWARLFEWGWFPFVGLTHDHRQQLLSWATTDRYPAALLEEICRAFAANLEDRVEVWQRRHELVAQEKDFLATALARFRAGDNVSCISVLYPRIEGVMRRLHAEENPGQRTDQDEMVTNLVENQYPDSLLLPQRFGEYLHAVYFQNFNLSRGELPLSRHSHAHGVSQAGDYNFIRAAVGFMIFDQLCHYLTD